MLLFLWICQWRVCKIVCNFQHYFGGRSKRESSCLEIKSSAQFLLEIWISYFARIILEGVFVGGIVNIRNECLFFSVHGKWTQCGTNKSRELRSFFLGSWEINRSAEQTNRVNRDLFVPHCVHFPWTEKKRHSFLIFTMPPTKTPSKIIRAKETFSSRKFLKTMFFIKKIP